MGTVTRTQAAAAAAAAIEIQDHAPRQTAGPGRCIEVSQGHGKMHTCTARANGRPEDLTFSVRRSGRVPPRAMKLTSMNGAEVAACLCTIAADRFWRNKDCTA